MAEKSVLAQNLTFPWHIYLLLLYLLSTYHVPRLPAVNKAEMSLKLPEFMFWGMLIVKVEEWPWPSEWALAGTKQLLFLQEPESILINWPDSAWHIIFTGEDLIAPETPKGNTKISTYYYPNGVTVRESTSKEVRFSQVEETCGPSLNAVEFSPAFTWERKVRTS